MRCFYELRIPRTRTYPTLFFLTFLVARCVSELWIPRTRTYPTLFFLTGWLVLHHWWHIVFPNFKFRQSELTLVLCFFYCHGQQLLHNSNYGRTDRRQPTLNRIPEISMGIECQKESTHAKEPVTSLQSGHHDYSTRQQLTWRTKWPFRAYTQQRQAREEITILGHFFLNKVDLD